MLIQKKNIDKKGWLKEGFLLEMAPDRYLLGEGPFVLSSQPDTGKWSLFHPLFFDSFLPSALRAYWCIPLNTAFFSKKKLLAFLQTEKSYTPSSKKSLNWCPPSFSVFRERFSLAQDEIKHGLLKKVVPVFFETADFYLTFQDKRVFLYHLILSPAEYGMAYATWSKDRAIMGRTPEILFQTQENYLSTMALAGTARDKEHNLMEDQKERTEHEWVKKTIKKKLATLGECGLSGPQIYAIGPLRHLRTDFEVKLKKQLSFHQLCSLLHPTPALGGVPTEQALRLLKKWDQPLRYGFGAPFGVALGDKALCVVAIRNAQFLDKKVFIGSGVGLIKESDLEREWQELKQKRNFIKHILFP